MFYRNCKTMCTKRPCKAQGWLFLATIRCTSDAVIGPVHVHYMCVCVRTVSTSVYTVSGLTACLAQPGSSTNSTTPQGPLPMFVLLEDKRCLVSLSHDGGSLCSCCRGVWCEACVPGRLPLCSSPGTTRSVKAMERRPHKHCVRLNPRSGNSLTNDVLTRF